MTPVKDTQFIIFHGRRSISTDLRRSEIGYVKDHCFSVRYDQTPRCTSRHIEHTLVTRCTPAVSKFPSFLIHYSSADKPLQISRPTFCVTRLESRGKFSSPWLPSSRPSVARTTRRFRVRRRRAHHDTVRKKVAHTTAGAELPTQTVSELAVSTQSPRTQSPCNE